MIDRRLTILQVLPRLAMGGAERVAIETAEAIKLSGHRALIAAASGPFDVAATRAGAALTALPLATKNPLKIWRNIKSLERVIKSEAVDLVHAHSRAPAWSAYYAARRCKVPFVTSYHGAYSETSGVKRRYNRVMALGDLIVVPSRFIAGLVMSRYGVAESRVRVVHGGVNPLVFDPAAVLGDRVSRLAKAWRLDMSRPVVMLPARLTTLKGHKLLIEALAQMRHADALAVCVGATGRPAYMQSLLALARQRGVEDRLRLVGPCDDMPAAMMLADVVVNASLQPESFGLTIIEGQAMGRVVVAAGHGGALETVRDGETGFLFPPGDAPALATMLDHALDMPPEARIAFGQAARAETARNFSVEAMQLRMLTVYAELLT
ncbi:glycosyltransferase family 4 protein [Acidocella sp.]|uniref:glycosyltransferase family 4 protein n=2 Tax=Acidocella sp. TaxID=50710 RepID=UPI002631471B|nr:glycosyltransferase family 4 protein [Acidocella sp.]